MTKTSKPELLPFSLTLAIVVLDQLSKWFVARYVDHTAIPYGQLDRFFLLVHHKNTGFAFSLGNQMTGIARSLLLVGLPLVVLAGLAVYYFKSPEFSKPQRWALCGVLGGGVGNLIDRIFRPDGVVDFLSFRVYGLFGMERWPTFNIADSAVVLGCCLLLLTSFVTQRRPPA